MTHDWADVSMSFSAAVATFVCAYLLAGFVVATMFPRNMLEEIFDFARGLEEGSGKKLKGFNDGLEFGRTNSTQGMMIGVVFWPALFFLIGYVRFKVWRFEIRLRREVAAIEEQTKHILADPWQTACMCDTCRNYRRDDPGRRVVYGPEDESYDYAVGDANTSSTNETESKGGV